MTKVDYQQLLSEKTVLRRMLDATSDDQVITRVSLNSRLATVESRLASSPVDERAPATMKLTFRGKPVGGREGIFADFGTKVVSCFNEFLAKLAASVPARFSDSGRGPTRGHN